MGASWGPENPISGPKSSQKYCFLEIPWNKWFKTLGNHISMESMQYLGYANIILHTNTNRGPS